MTGTKHSFTSLEDFKSRHMDGHLTHDRQRSKHTHTHTALQLFL